MKVIGSRSRSQEHKGRESIFPQCKTLIGNNSGFVKHRAMKFTCIAQVFTALHVMQTRYSEENSV